MLGARFEMLGYIRDILSIFRISEGFDRQLRQIYHSFDFLEFSLIFRKILKLYRFFDDIDDVFGATSAPFNGVIQKLQSFVHWARRNSTQ